MRRMTDQRVMRTVALAMLLLASSAVCIRAQEKAAPPAPASAEPGAAKAGKGGKAKKANKAD